jgi:uncharacterized membrane protein
LVAQILVVTPLLLSDASSESIERQFSKYLLIAMPLQVIAGLIKETIINPDELVTE